MSTDEFRALPAPHDSIRVWVSSGDRRDPTVSIMYQGPDLQALRAAGCITDEIFEFFANSRRRLMYTLANEGFCARSRIYGPPIGVEIIRNMDPERASHLPGVAGCMLAKAIEAEKALDRTQNLLARGGKLHRDRCVGRHQRRVRWTVIDQVIVVNWLALVRERREQAKA